MNLVGRPRELAELRRAHGAARAGSPETVVLVGEPGQGKTALLAWFAAIAREDGSTVLWSAGAEFESELPFSSLSCLLVPLLGHLSELPADQAGSLRAALGLAAGGTPGLRVYAATLALLSAAARQYPVVVVIDDAHWVDRASLDALLFCARRLHDEHVAMVFATRDDTRFRDAGLATTELNGLTSADATTLLGQLGVRVEVARRISEATGGNPLAMHEITRGLSEGQRSGRDPLPDPLPIGRRLIDAYAPRLAELPDRTRDALQIAAIETSGDIGVIERALERFELSVDDLDAAEQAHLVACRLGELQWVHPLARAAAYHLPEQRRRREIHRAIGDTLDEHRHASRVAWHLASSTSGRDEAVACRLEEVGIVAVRQGALLAAADAFDWAARLSVRDTSRVPRWQQMGESLWWAGETERTVRQLDAVIPLVADPEQRANLVMLAGQADVWHTGPPQAVARLEHAAASVEGARPHLAAMLLSHAAVAHLLAGDSRAARAVAERAQRQAARGTEPAGYVATAAVAGVVELVSGDRRASDALLDPLRALVPSLLDTGLAGTETLAQLVALADVVTERWSDAETLLRRVMHIGEERGLLGLYGFADSQLADLWWRAGRWSEAATELVQLVSLTEATGQPIATHYAYVHLALLEGGRGMADSCRRHAGDAIELADRLGMGALSLRGRSALGLLALSIGQPAEAARHLDLVAAGMSAGGNAQPASLWWQADYVEALVASGRHHDAYDAISRLRDQLRTAPSRWAAGALHRAEALVDPRAGADDHLTEAIACFSELGALFETARTLLLRGERRIEADATVDGRRDVAAARRVFDGLGARPWSDRATTTLGRPPASRANLAKALSQAEWRIARAVSNGESNRLAAERLHLSVKTVDYHLQNIYRKLSVRNRTHLARVLSSEPGAPDEVSAAAI